MSDDPFAPITPKPGSHPQATVLKPAPGGRGPASSLFNSPQDPSQPLAQHPVSEALGQPNPGRLQFDEVAAEFGAVDATGANPILAAATQLLALAGQLRHSSNYADVDGLFRQLCQEVRVFEAQLNAQKASPEEISIARYTLCGFLDEAILNTPWGGDSGWGSRTLLAEFHNEVDAGEKVFAILDRIKPDPARYVQLLELIYVCLSLGFQGKYRRQERGYDELDRLRVDLASLIARQRGPYEPELSGHWQGATALRPKFTRFVPIWVVVAALGLILLLVFGGLLRWLYSDSDPVMRNVNEMGRYLAPVVAERVDLAPVAAEPMLVDQLQAAIRQGLLEAGVHNNVVVVRGLFASGSVAIEENNAALQSVAKALTSLRGNIRVTGHTDNVPIRTLRFPSNWELSEARAGSVRDYLLGSGLTEQRLLAEARADTQPVCEQCNQSDFAERAKNRRVEIELLPGAGRQ